jgi:hypothetical protein
LYCDFSCDVTHCAKVVIGRFVETTDMQYKNL